MAAAWMARFGAGYSLSFRRHKNPHEPDLFQTPPCAPAGRIPGSRGWLALQAGHPWHRARHHQQRDLLPPAAAAAVVGVLYEREFLSNSLQAMKKVEGVGDKLFQDDKELYRRSLIKPVANKEREK